MAIYAHFIYEMHNTGPGSQKCCCTSSILQQHFKLSKSVRRATQARTAECSTWPSMHVSFTKCTTRAQGVQSIVAPLEQFATAFLAEQINGARNWHTQMARIWREHRSTNIVWNWREHRSTDIVRYTNWINDIIDTSWKSCGTSWAKIMANG